MHAYNLPPTWSWRLQSESEGKSGLYKQIKTSTQSDKVTLASACSLTSVLTWNSTPLLKMYSYETKCQLLQFSSSSSPLAVDFQVFLELSIYKSNQPQLLANECNLMSLCIHLLGLQTKIVATQIQYIFYELDKKQLFLRQKTSVLKYHCGNRTWVRQEEEGELKMFSKKRQCWVLPFQESLILLITIINFFIYSVGCRYEMFTQL